MTSSAGLGQDGPSVRPLLEELLERAGYSDGTFYKELVKGWPALNAKRQEEFKLCLIDELRRRGYSPHRW